MSKEVNLYENHDDGTGGWAEGTVWVGTTAFRYETKHFDEPSEFGIGHGRISKLWLRRRGDVHPSLCFDRGWERGFTPRGKGAEVNAIYKALVAKFN